MEDPLLSNSERKEGLSEYVALMEFLPTDLTEHNHPVKCLRIEQFLDGVEKHLLHEEATVFTEVESKGSEELKAVVKRLRQDHAEIRALEAVLKGHLEEAVFPLDEGDMKAMNAAYKAFRERLLIHAKVEDTEFFPETEGFRG